MRQSTLLFRDATGTFYNDRFKPLIEGITNAVLSNSIKQGEYFIVSDDGLFVGDQHDFDSDVLLNAIKIDDVVDFDNASPYNDFVDLTKVDNKKLLSNLSSNS